MIFLARRRARRDAQRLIATAQIEAAVIRSQAYQFADEIIAVARATPATASSVGESSFAKLWSQVDEPDAGIDGFFASVPHRSVDEMFS